MSACECSPCGRKFTGLANFDKHQDVNYSRRPAVVCLDPAGLGMRLDRHGRWGLPSERPLPASWGRQIPAEQPPGGGSA